MRDTDVRDTDVSDSDKDRPAPDVPRGARDSYDVSLDALPGFLLEETTAGERCGSPILTRVSNSNSSVTSYFDLPLSAASSCRTLVIVPAEKSLRFLFFWRRLLLLE